MEGSKTFTKEVCDAAGIPTALWERFDDPAAAHGFVRRLERRYVRGARFAEMRADLRRFFHEGQEEKLRLARTD